MSVRRSTTSQTQALQSALGGCHAAVSVLAALAARTSRSAAPDLYADVEDAWRTHRTNRDWLVRRLVALSATPAAAAPSYALPNAASTPDEVRRAALTIEQRMTDVYGTLVARTTDDLRGWAIGCMDESAVRQLRLRGRPEIFPGTGGLGSRAT